VNNVLELISELCADGVPYVSLGDIGKVSMCKRVFKEQTTAQGDIPFYKIGTFGKKADSFISEELYTEYKHRYPYPKKGDILISASGTIGRTVVYDGRPAYFQDSNIIWIDNNEKQVLNSFLLHVYKTVKWQTEGGTIARLYNDNLKKIKIPAPPIEIQKVIVEILDSFSHLVLDLEEEFNLRQKQLEYYRKHLLSPNFTESKSSKVRLRDIAKYSDTRIAASDVNNENYVGVDNLLPDRQGKTVSSFVPSNGKLTRFEAGDILIGNIRPYLKKIWLATHSGGTNGDVLVVRIKQEFIGKVLPDYIYHCLASDAFFKYDMQYSKGAKMPRGDKEAILGYEIALPGIAEQARIISSLNDFDELIRNMPVEVRARKKQIDFFQNELLTFQEMAT
jgi:type I restriction enzyme S subunit